MKHTLAKLMLGRQSVRRKVFQSIVRKAKLLPYELRLEHGAIDRPHYGYCLLQAASLAKKLGHKAVSAIEFVIVPITSSTTIIAAVRSTTQRVRRSWWAATT